MAIQACKSGHSFEKTSDCPTCPICAREELTTAYKNGFPKIGAPAYIALKNKGINLVDLPKYSEEDLLSIHGVGPKAVSLLRQYLEGKN